MIFDKIIKEKIIKRLGLNNTSFKPSKNVASTNYENGLDQCFNLGEVHDRKARLLSNIGISTGHAGIFSTSEDILKFLLSILNNDILKKETLELMLRHYDINHLNTKKIGIVEHIILWGLGIIIIIL